MRKRTGMLRRAAAALMAVCMTLSLPGSFGGNSVKEAQAAARRNYSTENVIPAYEGQPAKLKKIDANSIQFYIDNDAYWYAEENHCQDYLIWLADYIINKVEPQAVEMLLRIPCFREAVDQGLISRYMTLELTYDEEDQFGALDGILWLGRKGNIIDPGEEPFFNIGQRIFVNLMIFDKSTRNDPEKQRELQDTLVHELLHAFMNDYNRNGMSGFRKDGKVYADVDNRLPGWIIEGTAVSVEANYSERRDQFLELLMLEEDMPKEEILAVLSDPDAVFEVLADVREQGLQMMTAEEYAERFGSTDLLPTSLTADWNRYTYSYFGVMGLYYMAARSQGLEAFDEDGTVQMDVMLQGLDMILEALHNGYSMDQIIAEISRDPDTGEQYYADTADYERKFMQSADDLGTLVTLSMMKDFESRIEDPKVYVPSGSVLPGFNNYMKDFMDGNDHAAPKAFEIIRPDTPDPANDRDCYAVSTVHNSLTALGGGRSISYAGAPALTDAEAKARDVLDTGGKAALVDNRKGDTYKSTNDWIWVKNN